MLEASEDLTSLSHLNEPAGKPLIVTAVTMVADLFRSTPSD